MVRFQQCKGNGKDKDPHAVQNIALDAIHAARDLLAGMGHEIRTSLNVLLGNIDLVARSELPMKEQIRYEIIRSTAGNLLTIVDNILDFAKCEAGRMTITEEPFDIVEMTGEIAASFAPLARQKNVSLSFDVPADIEWMRYGDQTRVRQIILNLLSNAVKFTHAGSIEIVLTESPGQEAIEIGIRDTGIGIPADKLGSLFTPFGQADPFIARQYGGSGLGLVLSERLAHQMGGRIEVASTVGEGSRFRLLLPLKAAPQAWLQQGERASIGVLRVAQASDQAWTTLLRRWNFEPFLLGMDQLAAFADRPLLIEGDPGQFSGEQLKAVTQACSLVIWLAPDGPPQPVLHGKHARLSCHGYAPLKALLKGRSHVGAKSVTLLSSHQPMILVVDDHHASGMLLAEQLQRLGYRARTVANGSEALAALERTAFDLLITDLSMPEMDGFTLARNVATAFASVPIMALSADVSESVQREAFSAGIGRLLLKPVSMTVLARQLSMVLRNAAPQEPIAEIDEESDFPPQFYEVLIATTEQSLAAISIMLVAGDDMGMEQELHRMKGAFQMARQYDAAIYCDQMRAAVASKDRSLLARLWREKKSLIKAVLEGWRNAGSPSR